MAPLDRCGIVPLLRLFDVFDREKAAAFGITIPNPNQVVIMFHCGSRGFGHQIATDYLQTFLRVMTSKYGISVHDRELASAPFRSPEGEAYFSAMKCAVNMGFANQMIKGQKLLSDMEQRGIYVRTASYGGLAEEAGFAYKNIDEVATATELAGLSKRVVKLVPIGNIKG
ncbi:RtcB family protein [Geobacter argillaceus]|uniref:3'-phosphate/5'-hydroxy nucleic acid ligase n=1 Tax=Geobacter argillaceus TaxID=345631 RepID=A0A562V6X8_9BACT|nr:RtcB family protein [Geobacter argillaceus]TWJ13650.1 tRNA-splicing ligase RtcB [Geobacter argillaceus]